MPCVNLHIGFRDREDHPTDPAPKQHEAMEMLRDPTVLYPLLFGGTRAMKTCTAVAYTLEYSLSHPGSDWLLGHSDLKLLRSSVLFHLLMQVPETMDDGFGGQIRIREHDQAKQIVTITIPGKIHPTKGYTACYFYWPLDPRRDFKTRFEKSGADLCGAILDQAELMSHAVFHAVVTRITRPPFKIILTQNPDPRAWTMRMPWFDDMAKLKAKDAGAFQVMVLTPYDNPFLDPRYIETMIARLPQQLQDRYLHAKNELLEGLVYSDFDMQRHTWVPHFPIPSDHHVYEFIDPGFSDPFAVEWWTVSPDNILRQWYIETLRQATPSEASALILSRRKELMSRGRGGAKLPQFIRSLSDPSAGQRGNEGRTLAQQLYDYEDPEGDRLTLTLATAKGMPREAVRRTRCLRVIDMFRQNRIFISLHATEWLNQQGRYVWNNAKDAPADIRSYNADGSVQDHYDHMKASEYGIAWIWDQFNALAEAEEEKKLDYIYPRERDKGPFGSFRSERQGSWREHQEISI